MSLMYIVILIFSDEIRILKYLKQHRPLMVPERVAEKVTLRYFICAYAVSNLKSRV